MTNGSTRKKQTTFPPPASHNFSHGSCTTTFSRLRGGKKSLSRSFDPLRTECIFLVAAGAFVVHPPVQTKSLDRDRVSFGKG